MDSHEASASVLLRCVLSAVLWFLLQVWSMPTSWAT